MSYNPNIHHRRSVRLQGYDYSQAGLYFITICCHNREYLFGNITNEEMKLNDAGKIADECWIEIPNHFPNAVLHEYVVMPNHVHGVIELVVGNNVGANNHSPENDATTNVGANNHSPENNATANVGANNHSPENNATTNVGANNHSSLQTPFKSPSKTIGSIVRGFKIGVTKWCRQHTDTETIWQRNYHEHIIRNEQSYLTISEYIINNPKNWKDDKFYNQ